MTIYLQNVIFDKYNLCFLCMSRDGSQSKCHPQNPNNRPCKGIQESLAFWIPRRGFRIPR